MIVSLQEVEEQTKFHATNPSNASIVKGSKIEFLKKNVWLRGEVHEVKLSGDYFRILLTVMIHAHISIITYDSDYTLSYKYYYYHLPLFSTVIACINDTNMGCASLCSLQCQSTAENSIFIEQNRESRRDYCAQIRNALVHVRQDERTHLYTKPEVDFVSRLQLRLAQDIAAIESKPIKVITSFLL